MNKVMIRAFPPTGDTKPTLNSTFTQARSQEGLCHA